MGKRCGVMTVWGVLVVVLCLAFTACTNKPAANVTDIEIVSVLNMNDSFADLPEIKVCYNNGTKETVGFEKFWFNANYVYVKDGVVFIKTDAPYIFEDEMQITYKDDKDITSVINITKQYVELENITLSVSADTCRQGETLQFVTNFAPANASDKMVEYTIVQGAEFAQINGTGLLTVNETAAVGEQIKIKATAVHADLPPAGTDGIDESNIVTITITKSFEVITVDENTESVFTPEKEGFAFCGYYSEKGGKGVLHFGADGAPVGTPPVGETKLYAFWLAACADIYVYDGDAINVKDGQSHTKNYGIGLNTAKLQELGYTKIQIDMIYEVRAENAGVGRAIWLDIDNKNVKKKYDINIPSKTWCWLHDSAEVDIELISNTSVMRIGMDAPQSVLGRNWWFNEAFITFTALKPPKIIE